MEGTMLAEFCGLHGCLSVLEPRVCLEIGEHLRVGSILSGGFEPADCAKCNPCNPV